nr:uncharacterized protein LOC100180484 isoform X2 [Ciona intestinalis]|eukprot:XP_026692843.1 uncharacterized protein LOC100180484 isoform X2 [Ciona intestinalis]
MDVLKRKFKINKSNFELTQLDNETNGGHNNMLYDDNNDGYDVTDAPVVDKDELQTRLFISDQRELEHNQNTTSKFMSKSLVDVLCCSTSDEMVLKLFERKLIELRMLATDMWVMKHTCLMKVFQVVLDQYLVAGSLNVKQHAHILTTVQQKFSSSLVKFRNKVNENEIELDEVDLMLNDVSNQHVETMVSEYRSSYVSFIEQLVEYIHDDGECKDVTHGLDKSLLMVELHVNRWLEHKLKEWTDRSRHDLLLMFTYFNSKQTTSDLFRVRCDYYKSLIQRLSEISRISEHDTGILWVKTRDNMETVVDEVEQGFQTARERLEISSRDHWDQIVLKFNIRKNKLLRNYLVKSEKKNISSFIEGYFDICFQLLDEETKIIEESNQQEVVELAELQKRRGLLFESRCKEEETKMWRMIETSGGLNEEEVHLASKEMDGKMKKAEYDITQKNKRQTKVFDDQLSMLGSLSTVDAAHRNHISKFFTMQIYLTPEDEKLIMKDHELMIKMMGSSCDVYHRCIMTIMDARLIRTQVIHLCHGRQEEINEEQRVKSLAAIGNEHLDKFRHLYDTEHATASHLLHILVVEKVSEKLVLNLKHEISAMLKLEEQNNYLQISIVQKVVELGQLDSDVIRNLLERHQIEVIDVEQQLRQEHEISMQLLQERIEAQHEIETKKFDQVSKNTRNPALLRHRGDDLSVGNILDKLLKQTRVERMKETKQEEWEKEKFVEIFLQKIKFVEKLGFQLWNLNKLFLCKMAQMSKMKQKTFLLCVKDALACCSTSEFETRKLVSEFSRHWETSGGKNTKRQNKAARLSGLNPRPQKLRPIKKRKKAFLNRVSAREHPHDIDI